MMSKSSSSSGKGAKVWLGGQNLDTAFLRNGRSWTAEISLYGAQVISWKNQRGEEMLFLSKKAIFKKGELIRGGIPIGFPKSLDDERDLHSFASKSMWRAEVPTALDIRVNKDEAFIDLFLMPPPHLTFPHNFEMRLTVLLNRTGQLIMTTRVRNLNTNGKPFSFTFAYHNHLSVMDSKGVHVEGLQKMDYRDYLEQNQLFTRKKTSVTFESEVDRLYLPTVDRVTVVDYFKKRSIVIRKDRNLPDFVVWNLWDETKAKKITNYFDYYDDMLCIGPACMETPITLEPGFEWEAMQELTALTY